MKNSINIEYFDYFINDKLALSDGEFVFLLPDKNIIFIKSGEKVSTINIESIYFAKGEFKQTLCELLKDKKIIVSDYKSASLYFSREVLSEAISIENLMKIKNDPIELFPFVHSKLREGRYFETIDFLVDKFKNLKELNEDEKIYCKNLLIKDIATDILSNSLVHSNSSLGGLFKKSGDLYVRKIDYNSKRAVTGRITCSDKFNLQTIAHNDERRKLIISRFEKGFLINFDYNSFETRLSLFLTKNKEFIEKFCDKDLHKETAKIIFDKNSIDDEERGLAKNVNHAIIFGAGKDAVIDILKEIDNNEDVYKEVIKFLSPMMHQEKILEEEYKKNGFIRNYFGTFVYPNKQYALFNNYVQSSAADIIARKIISVNNILIKYKSKIITAIHDSIIVDFHPDEEFLIDKISDEMRHIADFDFNLTNKKTLNLFEE